MEWNMKTKFQARFESRLTNSNCWSFSILSYDCKKAEYVAREALNYASIGYEFLTWHDRMNNCLEDECRGCLEVNWNKRGMEWAYIYAPFAFQ